MSLLAYVKSLLPSFGRDAVLDDLTRIRTSVDDVLLPAIVRSQKAFRGQKLVSGLALSLEASLRSRFKQHAHHDLFDILHSLFADVPGQLDALEKLVEEQFAKDQTTEALTYRRATVLKYNEILAFTVDYATRMVIRVLAAESYVLAGTPGRVDDYLTQREKDVFESKYGEWLNSLGVIAQGPQTIISAIEQVPDVIVDDKHDAAVTAQVGARNIDPLKMNFITPSWNPIYKIRMVLAEWDVAAIQRAKEEKQLVELRLHELEGARAGTPNARLEQQIEITNDRLRKINFRIVKLSGDL